MLHKFHLNNQTSKALVALAVNRVTSTPHPNIQTLCNLVPTSLLPDASPGDPI